MATLCRLEPRRTAVEAQAGELAERFMAIARELQHREGRDLYALHSQAHELAHALGQLADDDDTLQDRGH